MAKLYAIYQQPQDPAAFDHYYFTTHVPLAKKIPGLLGYEVTRGDVMGMGGKHGVYLVATLEFVSMQDIAAAMACTCSMKACSVVSGRSLMLMRPV